MLGVLEIKPERSDFDGVDMSRGKTGNIQEDDIQKSQDDIKEDMKRVGVREKNIEEKK